MKSTKLFFMFCSFVLLCGALVASSLSKETLPEYYLSTGNACIQITFNSGCVTGFPNCVKTFSPVEVNRPVYDTRFNGQCFTQLQDQ